jgi:uncharacterized protein (TIGR03435 family)
MNAMASHLWQSTAFAAAAALTAVSLRRYSARTRHWIWLAASVKFLFPFAILTAFGTQVAAHAPLPQISVAPKLAAQLDFEWGRPPGLPAPNSTFPNVIPLLWAAGTLLVATRWTLAWFRLRRLVRAAEPLPLPFPIPVRATAAAIEPGVFGIFRPELLLPGGIADRLSPAQFRAILAHELAHVRRRDNLWSALHMLVEALFWFHPLVWYIGARLEDERERACDEAVLAEGSHPEAYAGSILAACRLYLEAPLPCVSGVTGADLKRRIERIMSQRSGRSLTARTKLALATAAAAAACTPILIGMLRAQSAGYEVASIKPSRPGQRGGLFQFTHDGLTVNNVTLPFLIQSAYHLHDYQVTGGPSWVTSDRFDILAKADRPLSIAESRLALQKLLADRFHLTLGHESREISGYALVVASRGLKIQPLGRPWQDGDGNFRAGGGHLRSQGASLWDLAQMLTWVMELPVIDATGLDGVYEMKLDWTPANFHPDANPNPNRREENGLPAPDPNGGSIFTALQEQLGLKLESRKEPVTVYVIDRAQRPTEN